eukprot:165334-Chlamydomonas_euryale.AAC.1
MACSEHAMRALTPNARCPKCELPRMRAAPNARCPCGVWCERYVGMGNYDVGIVHGQLYVAMSRIGSPT